MPAGTLQLVTRPASKTKTLAVLKVNKKYKNKGKSKKHLIPIDPFGRQKFLKMRWIYASQIDTNQGGATAANVFGAQHTFNLNSITIPNPSQTSGSPLPQGLDEISFIYKHFMVYGALVRITFSNPSADGLRIGAFFLNSQDSQDLTALSLTTALSKRGCIVRDVNDSGSQKVFLKKYVNLRFLEGLTKNQFTSDVSEYQGVCTSTSGPSKIPKLKIACMNAKDTTQLTIQYRIEIDFYVKLYDRMTLTSSLVA